MNKTNDYLCADTGEVLKPGSIHKLLSNCVVASTDVAEDSQRMHEPSSESLNTSLNGKQKNPKVLTSYQTTENIEKQIDNLDKKFINDCVNDYCTFHEVCKKKGACSREWCNKTCENWITEKKNKTVNVDDNINGVVLRSGLIIFIPLITK